MATVPAQPQDLGTAFDQAFEAAEAEHAPKAEPEPEAGATESHEQQQPGPEAPEPSQASESSEHPLLSADEQKLTGSAREKAIVAAYTRKTMELAEQRKQVEAQRELLEALETNPQETIQALARQVGISLEPQNAGAPKQQQDELTAELSARYGPEEAAILNKYFQKAAAREVAPILAAVEAKAAEADLAEFTARHADWKTHEKAMSKIMAQLPNPNMSRAEYLDTVYYLATRDQTSAKQTAKVMERITKAANAAESATTGASPSKVKPGPPPDFGKKGLDDAFDVAYESTKRGEDWE